MRSDFVTAVRANQAEFGINLDDAAIDRLVGFYELVQEHNALLHLVGPCSAEEFAVRHILESLTLLEYLPDGAKFADVGAGAGLPSIPCLLIRGDLDAILIESKEKKADFLRTAVAALDLAARVTIVNRQFAETDPADCAVVTCRALDRFTERLPRLLKWSAGRTMFLFGGKNLRDALEQAGQRFTSKLMPLSEQRFLFVTEPRA